MWYVKITGGSLLGVALLLFALINRGNLLTIRWWWGPIAPRTEVSLVLGLLAAFGLGALTVMIIAGLREWRLRRRSLMTQQQAERMRVELDALRTAPLEGPLGGEQVKQPAVSAGDE